MSVRHLKICKNLVAYLTFQNRLYRYVNKDCICKEIRGNRISGSGILFLLEHITTTEFRIPKILALLLELSQSFNSEFQSFSLVYMVALYEINSNRIQNSASKFAILFSIFCNFFVFFCQFPIRFGGSKSKYNNLILTHLRRFVLVGPFLFFLVIFSDPVRSSPQTFSHRVSILIHFFYCKFKNEKPKKNF